MIKKISARPGSVPGWKVADLHEVCALFTERFSSITGQSLQALKGLFIIIIPKGKKIMKMSGKTTVFSHMCTKSSCVHLDLELLALFLLVDGCRVFFFYY